MESGDVLVWRPRAPGNTFGQVCIKYSYAEQSQPTRHTLYWTVTELSSYSQAIEVYPELADGKEQPLWKHDTAIYSFTRTSGQRVTIRIIGGGGAKAIVVEHSDVPEPKVRKGIETRWYNGAWQKYLKSEGWVYA